MKNIEAILFFWRFCQTGLKGTIRWSVYVKYEKNNKSARYNGIRRQNVQDHILSKLLAYNMILASLKKIFKEEIDFDMLSNCILFHDFGEPNKESKFDILANDKVLTDDVVEYGRFMKLLTASGLDDEMKNAIENAFLIQFLHTSFNKFDRLTRAKIQLLKKQRKFEFTSYLFQILEKWEYHFYAFEHRDKHPEILNNVVSRNKPLISYWINKYPASYRPALREVFLH